MNRLIETLRREHTLTQVEFLELLQLRETLAQPIAEMARQIRQEIYGNAVYIRGLIEVTNICKNDCYYCGIRRSNADVSRYRLSTDEILGCCEEGYALGFRTFVMQGGEDGACTDEFLTDVIQKIKQRYPDCAVTLSLGERSRESYQALYDAGADRYLLRHEAANEALYQTLHPADMSHSNRMQCLQALKEIGYQAGTGFMVGAPGQTLSDLAEDLCFLAQYRPHMVGIGPFVPHHATRFANEPAGTPELTTYLISLIRLMLPNALIPATTALNTVAEDGRIRGILAGANVVMPNLSPLASRAAYQLYDNKRSSGLESAQAIAELKSAMEQIGYEVVTARGDFRPAQ